ncbi:MAG: hypothetical protein H0T46_07950 [Deltaproteobacteria bacterium]|nr:hypothetical protein [Deltaproteobacteria bacterium]
MRSVLVAASLVVGLAGCGGSDKFDAVLGELEGFKNRMCACVDKACGDQVADDWRAYRATMKDKLGKDGKPSEAQDKRGRVIDEEMRACRRKLTGEAPAAEASKP